MSRRPHPYSAPLEVLAPDVFAKAASPEMPAQSSLPPSKSQRKRDMHDVQAMGEALVALSTAKLEGLALPERLFDAIVAVRTITRHEARRRQMQFIGRLMRTADLAPIRALLVAQATVPAAEKARMLLLEDWRRRLLEEPSELEALMTEFPTAFSNDDQRDAWQQRIARVQQERGTAHAAPRHYRLLFKELKALFDSRASVSPDTSS